RRASDLPHHYAVRARPGLDLLSAAFISEQSFRNNVENDMNDLDFSGKTVLVVGGSSGIGNGIAQAFRRRGADVHVWGTRASASDYAGDEGSDLDGLGYSQVDVSDIDAIERLTPAFSQLDILIQCQGTVAYRRGEFEREGWD